MFGSIFTSPDYIRRMQREQQRYEAQQRELHEQINRMNAQQTAAAARSAFDDGSVIDLVPTADGVYAVPAALEHRARSVG